MEKLFIFFLSCLFIFASSASAAAYKWADEYCFDSKIGR
jgi:hypothetical protein